VKVTIIGTGDMARAVGSRVVAGGHALQLMGRKQQAAAALASELDGAADVGAVGAAEIGEPVSGEVIVLAVPYEAVGDLLPWLADQAGQAGQRVIVDITNPIDWQTRDGLVVPLGSSAAEQIQDRLAGDRTAVVKAFNTVFAANLGKGEGAGQTVDVLIAGDDAAAKQLVATLATDGGLRAVDVGPLRRARELEAFQLLHIALQHAMPEPYTSAVRLLY
jgi:8-hydroxy-5-deazaflavin:NADPH oxidoreductase